MVHPLVFEGIACLLYEDSIITLDFFTPFLYNSNEA